ncbi:netrin receptor UNC5C-like isoform X2 [Leptidea sinapis]|uniref:netrin receptor UNC5C-like isoform X2 n=1 Tax=Leptidea sinapis TaxID=189913 RepID=UPI002143DA8A|nr:netrin receptor UNC5C-like isoform X2 [Leptidea sinapis]
MEVKFSFCLLLIQIVYVTGKVALESLQTIDDSSTEKNTKDNEKQLDFLVDSKNDIKDYFLPTIFGNNEEVDEDEEEEESEHYSDYDYKEANYKDSSDVAETKADDLPVDDKIPLHTPKDNLPVFLLEPENTYVVKNKPAILKCRAANALDVYFNCNGVKTPGLNFEFVDPQTGVRIIEGEYKVQRDKVEEYFGSEKYQCSCYAWTSRGHIWSQPATIELAYIKKHFIEAPQSQLVKLGSGVTFRCDPPQAAPFAQLYWLKNGAPLVVDDNVQITKESSLVFKQATLLDMANYTCVAENLAGKRMSEPALLTVFVNGGWTSWSAWSDCYCSGQPRDQGRGRRRVRSCTAPRPLNGGQPCIGPSVQKTQECFDCDLDVYVDSLDELADQSPDIVIGRWSKWSEWSLCDSDCLQTRRRRCLTSTACFGKDYQVAQCQLCVRTSKGMHDGSNYFGTVIKRTLNNQPDLIHEEFQTIATRQTNRQINNNVRPEHLYEVPQLANSYMSPIDREVTDSNKVEKSYVCKDNVESERSDSSCFLSSGSSYGNESVEISPSLKNNASLEIKFPSTYLETTTSKIVSADGNWLTLSKCGVSLFIPDGVVDKGEELFTVEVTDEEWSRPILQEGESHLSPVIKCGPKNYHFNKGVVLTFPHCAYVKNSSWQLSVLQRPEDVNTREWRRVLTLGQETPGTPIFAQVDPAKVYLVCEFLSDFVLVGKSFNGLDAKLLKLALFVNKDENNHYSLHIHVFNDTPYAFYECYENEKRNGGYLLCEPKCISFQENCSDLCYNVRDVGTGWKIQPERKYQELSYSHVWNMSVRSLYCVFALTQIDAINSLELNITIYQKQNQSNSVNFNLKTNDFNSNLNCNKRFSYSGVETGYSVNILENPFNYSSLSKREGRYDFAYKNIQRNNYTLDNNFYRINVLTKSDRVILCKLLDAQSGKGNDWRLLAEKLKLSSYYYYFSNTCSPTDNILNLWICRNNDANMLVGLLRIFREMGRIDCATVVERRCYP